MAAGLVAVGFLAGAALTGSAAPAQSVGTLTHQQDVQLADYWLMRRASGQSDPTGRQYRFFVQEIAREVIVEAIQCYDATGDPDCDPEGVPVP